MQMKCQVCPYLECLQAWRHSSVLEMFDSVSNDVNLILLSTKQQNKVNMAHEFIRQYDVHNKNNYIFEGEVSSFNPNMVAF